MKVQIAIIALVGITLGVINIIRAIRGLIGVAIMEKQLKNKRGR